MIVISPLWSSKKIRQYLRFSAIRRSTAASSAQHISDPISNSISHLCHLFTPTASSAKLCQAAAETRAASFFQRAAAKTSQPRLQTRDRRKVGGRCRTLNPVSSSFKVSTCLWLEPPLRWRNLQGFQGLQTPPPNKQLSKGYFFWDFTEKLEAAPEERKSTNCKEPQIYCSVEASQGSYLAVPPDIQIFIGK